MKGLLLKDVYELWGQGKALLFLIVLYLVIGESSPGISSVALLLCAMMPTNCIGYDERAKWDRYARSMPVSVRDLVVSKYVLGYLSLGFGVALKVIVMFTPLGKTNGFGGVAITAALALIYLAVQLPILFKCGVENGRIWMMLLAAGFAVGVVALGSAFFNGESVSLLGSALLPYLALAVSVVLQFPSILIAIKLYQTKT